MLKIYLDNVLINEDDYVSFNQTGTLFNESFELGSTVVRKFELTIPKSVFNVNTSSAKIEFMNEDYAHLVVDDYKIKEGGNGTAQITLVDRMMLTNFEYDYSDLVPCTTKDLVLDICDKIGVELATTSFMNDDVVIDWYDNTINARDYLSMVAELSGGFARIGNDGKMYLIKYDNDVNIPINPDLCEEIILGQEHEIERVVFDNGKQVWKTSNDEDLETLYLNDENVFINDEVVFNKITNSILGFKYINVNTGKTYALNDVQVGDVMELTYDGGVYYSIYQFDKFNFFGLWSGTYKLDLKSKQQEETSVLGFNEISKSIRIKVDRINLELSQYVGQVDELETKYTELQQTVDGIDLSAYSTKTETATEIDNAKTEILDTVDDSISESSGTLWDNMNEILYGIEGDGGLNEIIIENQTNISIQAGSISQIINETITGIDGVLESLNETVSDVGSNVSNITERLTTSEEWIENNREVVENVHGDIMTLTTRVGNAEDDIVEQKTHFQRDDKGLKIGGTEWETFMRLDGAGMKFIIGDEDNPSSVKSHFSADGFYNNKWQTDFHTIEKFEYGTYKATIFRDRKM